MMLDRLKCTIPLLHAALVLNFTALYVNEVLTLVLDTVLNEPLLLLVGHFVSASPINEILK